MIIKHTNRKVLLGFSEVITILAALAFLLPLYFCVINSLKAPGEAALLNFAWPSSLHFENYKTVFKEAGILNGLKNSTFITLSSITILLFLASMSAFIIDRRQSALTKFTYNYFIFGIIPSGFLIPTIYTLKAIGLYGTYAGIDLIYIAGGAPLGVFLIAGFIKTVPRELDESVVIDGGGVTRLFFSVIFPQLKPILATSFMLSFLGTWNDFIGPLVYLKSASQYTIPMSVFYYNSRYNTEWEKVFSVLMISTVPVILAYALAQKFIVEGMTAGAVKG